MPSPHDVSACALTIAICGSVAVASSALAQAFSLSSLRPHRPPDCGYSSSVISLHRCQPAAHALRGTRHLLAAGRWQIPSTTQPQPYQPRAYEVPLHDAAQPAITGNSIASVKPSAQPIVLPASSWASTRRASNCTSLATAGANPILRPAGQYVPRCTPHTCLHSAVGTLRRRACYGGGVVQTASAAHGCRCENTTAVTGSCGAWRGPGNSLRT